jgi:hypothetical protein
MWILLLSLLISAEAKRELWARVSDRDGHKIAANCFFSGHQPQLFQAGLLLRVNCYGESDLYSQLLYIQKKSSTQELLRSRPGSLLSEPVTDGQNIFVSEYNEAGTTALNLLTLRSQQTIVLPQNLRFLQGLSLSQGKLLARFQDQNGESQQSLWTQGTWSASSQRDVSFYFQPQASSQVVLQKVRRGSGELDESRPDEIVISLDGGESFEVVLQDRDADPSSAYLSFWNFSVVNQERWVVIARTQQGEVAVTGLGRKVTQVIMLSKDFESLDFWPPAIDLQGQVYVRAKRQGVHGLWRVGSAVELILCSGDAFQGDQDTQRVRSETPFYNAPMIDQNRLFMAVGVEDFNSSTFLGQALIEVLLP